MPSPLVGAIGSSVIGAGSARSAQRSQERSADAQLALQERIYDETTQRFEPYAQSGLDYQNALRYELLGGERPTFGATVPSIREEAIDVPGQNIVGYHDRTMNPIYETAPTQRTNYLVNGETFQSREAAEQYAAANMTGGNEYQGFQQTPGYQFALEQGQRAIDGSAASSGSLFSGNTLRSQMEFGQGLANQEYNNYLNRLTGGAASGQAAAGNQANAGANLAAGGSAALAARGNAGAAGAIGFGNALNRGIGDVTGIWNYQNQSAAGNASTPGVGIW